MAYRESFYRKLPK